MNRTGSASAPAVLLLTYNEEWNLPSCLASVAGWAPEIVVVDSGSTDRTREIAEQHRVSLLEHRFETHGRQWNWALENAGIRAEWILALDADHRLTPELRQEIEEELAAVPPGVEGYYLKRKQIFRGRWIRHGGYYPKYLLKLIRRGKARSDEREMVDSRFYVAGKTRKLRHDLIEDNSNDDELSFWIGKHLRYAALQAREERLRAESFSWTRPPSAIGKPDRRVLFLKRIWYRMPLYARPAAYFAYRYFLRRGFLDGEEGFVFHSMQAFWYRLLVDIHLAELRRAERSGKPARLEGAAT